MLFDLHAGFLDDLLLQEQWATLSSSALPVPLKTVLKKRLAAEMGLRNRPLPAMDADSSVLPLSWPLLTRRDIASQHGYLRERAAAGYSGRIPLPTGPQSLWASYKYAVMARSPQIYQQAGRQVAKGVVPLDELWLLLSVRTRQQPERGRARNALQHMWGYVSRYSDRVPASLSLPEMLTEIQQQALEHKITYLLNSTALSELMPWLENNEYY